MSDVPRRLLREALGGLTPPGAAPECLDAETVAAWADGALSARARAAAERHASSCARCQALVAAMARTAPPAARMRRHASAIRWIVPLAVAAAAAVVWAVVPPRQPRPPARSDAATIAPSSSIDAAKPAALASEPSASEPRLQAKSDPQRGAPTRADTARARQPRQEPTNIAPSAAPPVARDAAAAPPPVAATAPAPVAAAAPPLVAAAPTATAVEAAAPQTFASRGVAGGQVRSPGERAQAFAKTLDVPRQILSPDPNIRWRIVASGGVERSIDGGLTWQPQSTGAATPLTAGSAPSPTVCWLAGAGGLVLISTDGATWTRASLPEAIDLQSVRASDASNATVTTIDGRVFTTTDGGKTWRRAIG